MKNSLKRALPGCLGACLGVCLVNVLRHPEAWTVGSWLFQFAVSVVITTAIGTLIFWLWERVRGKKPQEENRR